MTVATAECVNTVDPDDFIKDVEKLKTTVETTYDDFVSCSDLVFCL